MQSINTAASSSNSTPNNCRLRASPLKFYNDSQLQPTLGFIVTMQLEERWDNN